MLGETIEDANRAYLGQFTPSVVSASRWPARGWFTAATVSKDLDV